jgi:hypothetical protein
MRLLWRTLRGENGGSCFRVGRDERKVWTEATMAPRHARLTVVTTLKFAFSQRKSPPITLALRVPR